MTGLAGARARSFLANLNPVDPHQESMMELAGSTDEGGVEVRHRTGGVSVGTSCRRSQGRDGHICAWSRGTADTLLALSS